MPEAGFEQQDERNVPKDEKSTSLHATALRHANEAWVAEQINIAEGREDQRFSFGEQWPAADKQERDRERRPSIVVNRLPQFKRQVTGDIRNSSSVSSIGVTPAYSELNHQPMSDVCVIVTMLLTARSLQIALNRSPCVPASHVAM